MTWQYSDRKCRLQVPAERQRELIDSLLATGTGGFAVVLFGMPGYIFPSDDEKLPSRVSVKTGSMVPNPKAFEFSYYFSGDQLILNNFQAWDEPVDPYIDELIELVTDVIS